MSPRPRNRAFHTLLGLLLTAGLLPLGHQRVDAYSYYLLGGAPVVWSGASSVRFLSPSTFPHGGEVETQFLSAMAEWNLVPGADFNYSFVRLAQDAPIDHFDGYSDTAAVPSNQLDPGVLGVTFLVNNGANWFDMDILFSDLPGNVGYTFDPQPDCHVVAAPTPDNGYSFLLVALHELGHALGLGHDPIGNEPSGTPWFIATMNPRYPSGGTSGQDNIIELHADDRRGARFLYPHSGPSGPPYVDLAASMFESSSTPGRAVPLTCTPATLYPGDELIIPSVIQNLGTTNALFVRQGFYLSIDPTIDTSDDFLGSIDWDIAASDALAFAVAAPLPADLPAGEYYAGSIIDDGNDVNETWEDNNAAHCCDAIQVLRLAPSFLPMSQRVVACGEPFVGQAPQVTHPLNMSPLTWSLVSPPPGMTIHPTTGVVSWPQPVTSPFLYVVQVRATNSAGSDTEPFFLGVLPGVPDLIPPSDKIASCAPLMNLPPPALSNPNCMAPILSWQVEIAPPGLHMDAANGAITWPHPVPRAEPYLVSVRAYNAAGSGSTAFRLSSFLDDFNGDARADLRDWPYFVACLAGPSTPPSGSCSCGDGNADGRLDLQDAAEFQRRRQP